MDERPDRDWQRFRRVHFDTKHISKRMRRAETATTRHARKFLFRRIDNMREVRRQIVSWLIIVGVIIVAVLLQTVWFGRTYVSEAAADGGTYAEADLGPIDTLNPLYAKSDAELAASRLMFSSLYKYDDTGHLADDLATNLSIDPTGTIYTVTIRPNATWSDGAKLTADDVVFTINLIKNPVVRSPLAINWQDVSAKAVNSTTIQFTLPAPYAAFPQALTFPVLPEHILESVPSSQLRENSFSSSPVGSGPFIFRLLQKVSVGTPETVVRLHANTSYYGGTPKLANFEIHAYSTMSQIMTALKTGEVNAASGLSPDKLEAVNKSQYRTRVTPVDNGVYALFNTTDPILKDASVRQALQLATNTNALRHHVSGSPAALDLPFIKGQLTGDSVPKAPTTDTAKAEALLTSDGWIQSGKFREKSGQQLMIPITTTDNPGYKAAAQSLAAQWRAIGVDTSVTVIDASDPTVNFVQDTLQPRNYSVLVYQLTIGADPDVFAYWDSTQIGMNGYNFSNYSNPIADATLSTARALTDPAIRQAKYSAFAKQWLSDVPAIGLYQGMSTYVYGQSIATYPPHAKLVTATDRFSNVVDWSVGSQIVYKTP
ncbi:MAG TPA: peptide ABC transporter substrate-binding protein [Candidatus Saccharimonadaceae bacterium]|nr:peptide ABC transporter substrate-binding protein [Candidatus Saccharimonadaceae bacterium]